MTDQTPGPKAVFDVNPDDYRLFEAVVGRPAKDEGEVAFAKGTGLL